MHKNIFTIFHADKMKRTKKRTKSGPGYEHWDIKKRQKTTKNDKKRIIQCTGSKIGEENTRFENKKLSGRIVDKKF